MNNPRIPQEYLAVAEVLDIPIYLAIEFYLRIVNKKGVDDLANKLAAIKGTRTTDIHKTVAALRKTIKAFRNGTYLTDHKVEVTKKTLLDEAITNLEERIGKLPVTKAVPSPGDKITEVVVSDFHIPFHNEAALVKLLDEDADVAIINGDFLDMYSASTHRKRISQLTVYEELAVGTAIMEKLAAKFKKVYCVLGNHDMRAINRMSDLAPQLLPLLLHPLEIIGRGFGNVEMLSHTVPNTKPHIKHGENHNMPYMGVIGDTVYGHFEKFCGSDAHERVGGWINENLKPLGLKDKPRVIIQAHTHRLASSYGAEDQVMLACGSMCQNMGYLYDNAGQYKAPVTGYLKMTKYNGVTDLDTLRLIKV